jgi:hypothetical protein
VSVHDLYVNGTSFKGLSGVLVPDWGCLYDVDVFRGENKVVPGLPGEVGVDLVRDAYNFSFDFDVAGATDAELVSRIAAVRAVLVASGGTYTLTRRLPQTLTPFYNDDTCLGQFRGLEWVDTVNPLDIRGRVTFRNLDGAWA